VKSSAAENTHVSAVHWRTGTYIGRTSSTICNQSVVICWKFCWEVCLGSCCKQMIWCLWQTVRRARVRR